MLRYLYFDHYYKHTKSLTHMNKILHQETMNWLLNYVTIKHANNNSIIYQNDQQQNQFQIRAIFGHCTHKETQIIVR